MRRFSSCAMCATKNFSCPVVSQLEAMLPLKNTVLASLEDCHGNHCVDVFVRADGTFGFEEYRRDAEDCGVWQSMHRYSRLVFDAEEVAIAQARDSVAWLKASGI